ncbi:MAG: RDD family protein [Candidatus Methanofastidiosia archaeon]|jgi:uncharacterized RDD family membrane protein YckC
MEDLTIETAENIILRYDTATVGSRSAAALLDYILILIILIGLNASMSLFNRLGGDLFSSYFVALFYIFLSTVSWGYFVVTEMVLNGSSIGKHFLHLKVIKDTGSPIDVVDSLARNFLRYIDLLPGTYLVGITAMMLNPKSKRLGDYVAGTVVVRTSAAPLDALHIGETPYDEIVKDNPSLSLITAQEYHIMRDYLIKRETLPEHTSYTLARKLATRMAQKLGMEPPHGTRNFVYFIESCVKYYQST